MESGKDIDVYESVHCGVILAVGSTFKDYSINHGIWSVRATPQDSGWQPTNLIFSEIKDERQSAPPPICSTKNYELFRYGELIYAVPHSLGRVDVRDEKERNLPNVVNAKTLQEIEKLISERISFADCPVLLDSYKEYNLVQYKNRIFAISQSLGDVDLARENEVNIRKYREDKKCILGTSLDEAKHLVDQLLYEALQVDVKDRDEKISRLNAQVEEQAKRIDILQLNVKERDETIETLKMEIAQRDERIEAFTKKSIRYNINKYFQLVRRFFGVRIKREKD